MPIRVLRWGRFHAEGRSLVWIQWEGPVPLRLVHKIRLGMLCHGVDLNGWPGGLCSSVHTGSDVERTVEAFRRTLDWLGEKAAL